MNNVIWDQDLIERFSDKWDWNGLSENSGKGLHTLEMLLHYEEKWNWDLLSANENLPFTSELIDKFSDRWNWDKLMVDNLRIDWVPDQFEKYVGKINKLNSEKLILNTNFWRCILDCEIKELENKLNLEIA